MDQQGQSSDSGSVLVEMTQLAKELRGKQPEDGIIVANKTDHQQGQSSDSGSSVIEISPLANELEGKLASLNSSKAQPEDDDGPPRIIVAKVRHLTRNVCNSEYDPDYVTIGPYNHHRHLPTQQDKLRSLRKILSAAEPSMTMEVYVKELTCLEPKARSCYDNTFDDIPTDQFVRMLLLDGCYLLSRFASFPARPTTANDAGTADGSSISSVSTSTSTNDVGTAASGSIIPQIVTPSVSATFIEDLEVTRDVFYLAENQIPFFVLEKIGELTASDGTGRARVGSWIADHALDLMKRQKYAEAAPAMVPLQPGNLLHLLHMHLKPDVLSRERPDVLSPVATGSSAADQSGSTVLGNFLQHMHFMPNVLSQGATGSGAADQSRSSVSRWRSATEYSYAGVNFRSRDMSEDGIVGSILDVDLDSGGGTLEVPRLDIDNETWRLLRNLMELEQRNRCTVGSYVTAYCVFMSQVACDRKDVELLRKRGVIVHAHGNDAEVAQHFTDLCKGIVFESSDAALDYLWETRQKLDRRSRSYARRWMAWIKRKYFTNPWLAVGLLAAAIGLVCALVQAIYSVLSYKQGRN